MGMIYRITIQFYNNSKKRADERTFIGETQEIAERAATRWEHKSVNCDIGDVEEGWIDENDLPNIYK